MAGRMWILVLATALGSWLCPGLQAEEAAAPQQMELQAARVIDLDQAQLTEERPVISAVTISPDGQFFATAGDDHLVRLWRVSDGSVVRILAGHTDWVRTVLFVPDGTRLISAGDDQSVRIWDVASGESIHQFSNLGAAIYGLATDATGQHVAATGFSPTVRVFDIANGQTEWVLTASCNDIRSVAFRPGVPELAAAGRDGQIRVWSLANGEVLRQIAADRQRIRCLAYTEDGAWLASAGDGAAIGIWNSDTGEGVCSLASRPGKIHSLAFLSREQLAAGTSMNVIRLWDLNSQTETRRLVGHTGSVAALAHDPATGTIVSGSFDTTVRFWNLTGKTPDTAVRPEATPALR